MKSKKDYRFTVIFLLCVIVVNTCSNKAEAFELGLATIDRSWHYFDPDNDFLDEHDGIGFEIKTDDVIYSVVNYTNSINEDSYLFTIMKNNQKHGVILGLATGYYVPVLPMIGYHYTFFKIFRLVATPIVIYSQLLIPLKW